MSISVKLEGMDFEFTNKVYKYRKYDQPISNINFTIKFKTVIEILF